MDGDSLFCGCVRVVVAVVCAFLQCSSCRTFERNGHFAMSENNRIANGRRARGSTPLRLRCVPLSLDLRTTTTTRMFASVARFLRSGVCELTWCELTDNQHARQCFRCPAVQHARISVCEHAPGSVVCLGLCHRRVCSGLAICTPVWLERCAFQLAPPFTNRN